jgi:LexA-binding, inner membrane-associated putative hydrolase
MDILAHALWAGAGSELARRHGRLRNNQIAPVVVLAVLPDLVQYVPLLIGMLSGEVTLGATLEFVSAAPGQFAMLPPVVWLFAHHLHCIMHSLVVAVAVSTLCWIYFRAAAVVLAGWWSHIVIDIFSHSAEYYAVPVLYPFSQRGFDGFAWNTPMFLAINYTLIIGAYAWLWQSRQHRG